MTEIEEFHNRSTVSGGPVVLSGINLSADIEKYRKLIDEWVHSYWLCRSCIQLLTDDNSFYSTKSYAEWRKLKCWPYSYVIDIINQKNIF